MKKNINKTGDWGLGIGDWAQSPIPNPQSPIPILKIFIVINFKRKNIYYKAYIYNLNKKFIEYNSFKIIFHYFHQPFFNIIIKLILI